MCSWSQISSVPLHQAAPFKQLQTTRWQVIVTLWVFLLFSTALLVLVLSPKVDTEFLYLLYFPGHMEPIIDIIIIIKVMLCKPIPMLQTKFNLHKTFASSGAQRRSIRSFSFLLWFLYHLLSVNTTKSSSRFTRAECLLSDSSHRTNSHLIFWTLDTGVCDCSTWVQKPLGNISRECRSLVSCGQI